MVIEGALYTLWPDGMKRMMSALLTQAPGMLRSAGLVLAVVGLGLVWAVRG